MAKCAVCGKRGFFLRVKNGLCADCLSKRKNKAESTTPSPKKALIISPYKSMQKNEKKYYQPDNYYTDTKPVAIAGVGTTSVITFEERKKISYPSKSGLYVAEILLLYYCSMGNYPHPKNGYPGLWWFEYGIRDVGAILKSLEDRGYIEYGTAKDQLPRFTIAQLKEIASKYGIKVSGKKADIISQIDEYVSNDQLESLITERKYKLTEKGQKELRDYEYVPFMHKDHRKTIDSDIFGPPFNVWEVNRRIGNSDPSIWKDVVDQINKDIEKYNDKKKKQSAVILKHSTQSHDLLQLSKELEAQDKQLDSIREAEQDFEESNDIDALISFWEDIWKKGGLLFNGSHWAFRLPDLYIKQKRYDDALKILRKIDKSEYEDKKKSYIERIGKLKKERWRD